MMTTTKLTLAALALSFATPVLAIMPRLPMPPLPQDAIVVQEGGEYALEGTLTVKILEGRHAWIGAFTHPVFVRVATRVPMVYRPGSPRPHPFHFRQVHQLMLTSAAGHDLVALAKLVGADTKLTVTGNYEHSPRTMTAVLKVRKVEIRGQDVPASLPSVQRLIAMAKKAVTELASHSADTHIVGELKASYQGGLTVEVVGRVAGHYPRPRTVIWSYDGLTGAVTIVGSQG
jgi:hypothetical protein